MPESSIKKLESGNIYFLYRPKIGKFAPSSLKDIQRFYLILNPKGKQIYRLAVIAEKKLPKFEENYDQGSALGRKYWGYVESLAKSSQQVKEEFEGRVYATKTVGERGQPSGRPAGEGIYEIFQHKDHTHLVYELVLPKNLGPVQSDLGIKTEGNFIISLINPQVPPPGTDFRRVQRAAYPKKLQKLFGKRKFISVKKTDFLNYPGSAFLLIGVNKEAGKDIEIDLELQLETVDSAKVFDDLRLEKASHRTAPLFQGKWA